MADYVVGDIQGCYKGLKKLLTKLKFNPQKDHLYAVGDLVARGEDSLSVLQYCYDLGEHFHSVLGNHDLHLLAISAEIRSAKPSDRLQKLLSYSGRDKLFDWIRYMPLALCYQKNTLITHAGLYPAWSFDDAMRFNQEIQHVLQQANFAHFLQNMYGNRPNVWAPAHETIDRQRFIVNAFTRMRYLDHNGAMDFACKVTPSQAPQSLRPWFQFYNPYLLNKRVVFGHWASLQGQTHSTQFIGLDTGYVWGNQLTAYDLTNRTRYSIKA